MNLPHLQQQSHKPASVGLGPKSLRALTQPIVVSRTGRQTGQELATDFLFDQIIPPPDASASYKTLEVQRENLLQLPYQRLAQIALDLSPEVNKGLHDFLRFVNPSHVLKNENEQAEMATRNFMAKLDTYYGSFRSHIDSLWSGIFLTGAAFPELVLGPGGREPYDLVFNDPNSARFKREIHPIRGPRPRLGQETRYGFKYLDDDPLVKYLGFDRLTDNPYGRPIIGPAVHSSVFLLGLIQDLRRAIANIGLSRMDYQLEAEELLRLIDRNPEIAGDDEATAEFINSHLSMVKETLRNLPFDEDYVHLSTVQVNYATNPMTLNLTGLDTIINTLQNNVVNGYKGISALVNILDSTTETHIRSQLEYFVSAIQSLQNEVSDMFETFFDIGNQVQGLQGETDFKFRRQRTADKKATAEIEQLRTDTVIKKVDAEIITKEEGREEIDSFRDELEVAV